MPELFFCLSAILASRGSLSFDNENRVIAVSEPKRTFSIDTKEVIREAELKLAEFFKGLGGDGLKAVSDYDNQQALFSELFKQAYIVGVLQATIFGACSTRTEQDLKNVRAMMDKGIGVGFGVQLSSIDMQVHDVGTKD